MQRNKKVGVLWLIVPFITLFVTLSLWAVAMFVFGRLGIVGASAATDVNQTILRLINVFLGLVGVIAVIGILVGVPIGIFYLIRKPEENDVNRLRTLPVYAGLTTEQIEYISKWSWGAFLGGIIWPLGNGLWLWALLRIIPLVGLYAWIKMSLSGRQMSWEKGGWKSFDQFKKRQQIVAAVAWALFVLGIFLVLS